MITENELIQEIFRKLSNNESIDQEVKIVNKKFKSSFILQYYIGIYYEKIQKMENAIKHFNKSIGLCHKFILPYFNVGNYYQKQNKIKQLKSLLRPIFNKDTLDISTGQPIIKYQLEYQLRMANLLLPNVKELKEARKTYEPFIQKIEEYKQNANELFLQVFKQACFQYGNILFENNHQDKSLYYFQKGLSIHIPNENCDEQLMLIEKELLKMFCISRNYVTNYVKCPIDINTLYDVSDLKESIEKKNKIRIGYLSPDFNKNAVGLFLTSLLKYFDKSKFEVFCYYTHHSSDEYTNLFKSYKKIHWNDVHYMSDFELSNLIQGGEIDILFDLIGHGIKNRMGVLALKPAPVIINYLGYPDYTHLSTIDYRLVDNITDSKELNYDNYYDGFAYREKLLKMPNCFICYTLFENEKMPKITQVHDDNKIRIGIMNRIAKYDLSILTVWKEIVKENKNIILCVKDGVDELSRQMSRKIFRNIPSEQIKFLSHKSTLQEYFSLFNDFDMCLDTYPYSGTTTTCSSLLMGVPVFTVYDCSKPHVFNVTSSILKNCGENSICNSLKHYKQEILKHCSKKITLEEKLKRRKRFLNCMNPEKFMNDFEKVLCNVYEKHVNL